MATSQGFIVRQSSERKTVFKSRLHDGMKSVICFIGIIFGKYFTEIRIF